ncbi:MAG: hypothetical protein Q9182_007233 [Xanthomendoza sp. 2 TL-2023]
MSQALQDYIHFKPHHNQHSAADGKSNAMFRTLLPKGHNPRICIVGAGIAGLRCAQVLGEAGLHVTVLEARDRIGGRMHQSKLEGHLVDHGPNWIHGLKENPILKIAEELGETLFDVPEVPPSIYDQAGNLLSKEDGRHCSGLMWEIIEEAFKHSDKESASIPQNQSLLDFFKLRLREKDIPDALAKRVLQVCRSWGDYVGGDIDRQSLKYFWLEETLDGGNVFVASTYKAILERIANDTLPIAKFHLSTKVTSITSEPPESKPSSTSQITVTTSANQTFSFDAVVVTAPLGYLKRNTATFHPPLPPRLLTAINNMSYGALEKVYLTFPTAFWLPPEPSTQQDSEQQHQPPPFFTQWLAPTYTPNNYPLECAFLSSLPAPHAHPTLLFYMHGPVAKHITTLTSPLPLSSPSYLTTLATFFRPYYALLPNYNPTCHHPTAALATNWQNDEFAGWGSYSNFQTSDPEREGVRELDGDIRAVREGMPERGVWFAGEHVGPFVALGTVSGAWLSGEAVAGRVLRAFGRGVEEGGGVEEEGVLEDGKVASKRGGTGLGV